MSGVPRHLVQAALDCFGVGDVREGVGLLLDALDEAEATASAEPPPCAVCGVHAWPGQTERHIFSAHHPLERAA